MKKIYLLSLSVLLSSAVFVQDKEPITYGVKVGLTAAVIRNLDEENIPDDRKSMKSFYVGGLASIPIGPTLLFGGKIYFEPGLFYVGKGTKQAASDSYGFYSLEQRISYLEIPMNFTSYYQVGTGKLMFRPGLYIGFALGGTAKLESSGIYAAQLIADNKPSSFSRDLAFGSNKAYKTADFGMNLGLGYQLKNRFSLNLDLSFSVIDISGFSPNRQGNVVAGIGLGYTFKAK